MHAKPDLRVFFNVEIAGSGSVIVDVIQTDVIYYRINWPTIPCRQSVDINFETEPLRSTAKPSGRSIKYSKIALNCQDVPAGWIRMPWCVFDLLDPRHIVWRKRLRLCWNPDRIVRWCGKIQLCRRAGCIYHWRFWLAYLLVLAEQKTTQKRKARR